MIQRKAISQWFFAAVAGLVLASPAQALDLDWSGQFWSEAHWVSGYTLGNGQLPDARASAGGYTVAGGGSDSAHFQTLFARLRPRVVINDNVYLKSEWWVGDPIYGVFGGSAPYPTDQRQYYSNQSRGSSITAQRLWLEVVSDVGTLQVGRAPLHWGLGLVWNSGEEAFSRYPSTGDVVRLVSKFGSFSFVPSVVKYSQGNSIGGACSYPNLAATQCVPTSGRQTVSDYSLQLKYENADEDLEGGVNFVKRIAASAQSSAAGYQGVTGVGAGSHFNTWDLYGRKRWGKFSLAGEVPLASGDLGGVKMDTFALATEATYQWSDSWSTFLKAGMVPGQKNISGATPDTFDAFYVNPNYKIGLILFNYALNRFGGPSTMNDPQTGAAQLQSIYDNPITNANYVSLGGAYQLEKWRFHTNWVYATARETAQPNSRYFNSWTRTYQTAASGVSAQSSSLGLEADFGATLKYDDALQAGLTFGWWMPGDFFAFSNVAGSPNLTNSVFASVLSLTVGF